MVKLVNVLVKGTPVKSAVGPVVEHVLKDEEGGDLGTHEPDRGEWHFVGSHAKVAADRVEQPDEWRLAGDVGENDDLGHLPNLSVGNVLCWLELPLLEELHTVDDEPRNAATKVNNLSG